MRQVVTRKGLYGNVSIDRAVCPECKETAFVIKGKMACCDLVVDKKKASCRSIERMSQPEAKRKTPSWGDKIRILSEQNHRCFWCNSPFDGVAVRIGKRSQKIVKLNPYWDHVEPYSWSYNNNSLNFVAACSICNGIKSNKMFDDIEKCRNYIMDRREKKGWT